METGYVLFSLRPGIKKKFLDKLREIDEVKEAKLVIGIYDAVARIEASNIEDIQRVYLNRIDKISGQSNSRLHIVACPRTRK